MHVDMKTVRDKFEKFLIALGATYITHTRTKMIEGKETNIPCITIGFPVKVKVNALLNESEFWKFFEVFRTDKRLPPSAMVKVIDSLGHALSVVPVMIPKMLDGIQTDIIEHPIIDLPKPVSGPAEHMKKYRPVPGGVSFIACGSTACSSNLWVRGDPKHEAHKNCLNSGWYGTIELAGKKYTGCWHLGSCWHCGMRSDGSSYPAGHGWAQPSPMDGGICPSDIVSYRHTFIIPVEPLKDNEFDYLLTNAADLSYVSADVLDFGGISVVYFEAEVGWECWSSSRTEGTTSGKIRATDVTIGVNYGSFIAYVKNCIEHSSKISGGSSGSSFLARPSGGAIGMAGINFAGSSTTNYAIALPAIARDYGLEFDWAAHPDGEPPECPPGQHWDPTQGKCVPDQPECPPGQHWDPDQGKCVPDEEPPTDCWTPFLECIMGWDGSDLDYLINCIVGLVVCLVEQGMITRKQKQAIVNLVLSKARDKKQVSKVLEKYQLKEKDYRGAFALGTLLGCGIFGALSIWFPTALPIFTFFGGLTAREIEHYFSAKSKEPKA
jgi:hypothetical protein